MKPFEWYEREQSWNDEVDANYEKSAAELVNLGYKRYDFKDRPSEFYWNGQTLILVRQLGSSEWYTIEKVE